MSPKKIPPNISYLKARLQPFGRPMFLGSFGILWVLGLCVWQYWNHPDWLNPIFDEPEVVRSNPRDAPNNPVANLEFSEEELAVDTQSNNLESLLAELEATKTLTPALPLQQEAQSANQSTELFTPLIPKQNSSTSNPFVTLTQDLLNRASLSDYNSLVKINSQGTTKPSSSKVSSAVTRIEQFSSLNRLSNPNRVPAKESPLEKAVNQLFSANSNPTPTVTESPTPTNTKINYVPGYSLGTNSYTPPATTPTLGSNSYNYLPQPQPVNSVSVPVSGTPNNFRQVSPQGFNQLNQSEVRTNPGFTSNLITPGLQPTQGQRNQFNQPNFNNFQLQPTQEQQNQFNQPNLNNSRLQTPQVQPPIQVYQPNFYDSPLSP
ncbi:MAG: hypothetical protein AB4426_24965 [Xenococcaceae cyanobacterium]